MLSATALVLFARGNADVIPVSEPLPDVPRSIAGWSGTDVQIDQDTLKVLGAGNFLSRIYSLNGQPQSIDLFVAYFPTQRTGVTIHSPKNCLPGAGWAFESSQYVDLKDANGQPHRVGEYVIVNGDSKRFAIYWYQAHGRSFSSEYRANGHLLSFPTRLNPA